MLAAGQLPHSDEAQHLLPECPGLHAPLLPFQTLLYQPDVFCML